VSPRLEFRRKSSRPAARPEVSRDRNPRERIPIMCTGAEPRRSPLLVVAGAAAAGIALARVIDWRSHAHPR
jgi:hypothetical protein